ncbi:hypothetical protein T4E_10689 [Trichinella pseudospiralis]|uniref:Uncharacterized protein n=1 Tax=Trichinella pseudospiralis TaxID=6337 RepID=A0A0V0YDE5_TRIPS|nr:hypothetical protein T4E_10689 [Trichinella pseudospiralis]
MCYKEEMEEASISVPLAISRLKFGHTLGQLIPNLPASNTCTACRTVRLACEATGELNFKVFISRLIPRDFAVMWQAAAKRQPQQKAGTSEDEEIDVTTFDSAVAKRSIATRCFPTRTQKSNKIRQSEVK